MKTKQLRIRLPFLLAPAFLIVFSLSCSDSSEPASRDECEAATDHVIMLLPEQEAGPDHPIIGRAIDLLRQGYIRISGDYKEAVRKYMAEATRGDVRCVLSCETLEELDDCK